VIGCDRSLHGCWSPVNVVVLWVGWGLLTYGRTVGLGALVAVDALLSVTLLGVRLFLVPALLLFAILLLGFTSGGQLLERMRARRFQCRVARAPRAPAVRHVVVARRMTSLAASALAIRPPPGCSGTDQLAHFWSDLNPPGIRFKSSLRRRGVLVRAVQVFVLRPCGVRAATADRSGAAVGGGEWLPCLRWRPAQPSYATAADVMAGREHVPVTGWRIATIVGCRHRADRRVRDCADHRADARRGRRLTGGQGLSLAGGCVPPVRSCGAHPRSSRPHSPVRAGRAGASRSASQFQPSAGTRAFRLTFSPCVMRARRCDDCSPADCGLRLSQSLSRVKHGRRPVRSRLLSSMSSSLRQGVCVCGGAHKPDPGPRIGSAIRGPRGNRCRGDRRERRQAATARRSR
jgi:hypothetical protein